MGAGHKVYTMKLYVIEADHGKCKIGVTEDPLSRLKQLESAGGFRAVNFFYVEIDSQERETTLLKKFASSRMVTSTKSRTEWVDADFIEIVSSVLVEGNRDLNTQSTPVKQTKETERQIESVALREEIAKLWESYRKNLEIAKLFKDGTAGNEFVEAALSAREKAELLDGSHYLQRSNMVNNVKAAEKLAYLKQRHGIS